MSWTKPNVNFERLYDNLGKTYEIGVICGIFYESLQNALDANASVIRYTFDSKTKNLIINDNGNGMNKDVLWKYYHGIAESDKDKKGSKKRYGIGASIYPMACKMVKTISKTDGFPFVASLWDVKNGVQIYMPSKEEEKQIISSTGTIIKLDGIESKHLHYKDRNINRALKRDLKTVIDDFFFLSILNLRSKNKNFDVLFNSESIIIKPIDKNDLTLGVGDNLDGRWTIQSQVKILNSTYTVSGKIYYLCKNSPSKSGIKFTTDKELGILNRKPYRRFEISADIVNRLGGIFVCSYLEDVQLSTRNGFNEKTKIWEQHEVVITKILEPIIKEIVKHRRTRLTAEELKLLSDINKCVEEVIENLPDFAVLGAMSKNGVKGSGASVQHGSIVATGLKGTMISGTANVHSPVTKNPKHKSSVIQGSGTSRKKKGAPPIELVSEKNDSAVWTDEKGRIIINMEHKMYKQTQKSSVNLHKWYISDLVGTELTSKLPIPDNIQDDVPAISKYIIMKKKEFANKVTEYWF